MKRVVSLLTILFLALTVGGFTSEASEFTFAVEPVIPDNQIDKNQTYYDLKLAPGQKEELAVNMRNDTDNDVKVGVGINSATTNVNGVVEYGKNEIKPDKTLTYNIKDLVDYPDEITIPKHSEKELKLTVQMPNEEYTGLIAGGITFQEIKDEKAEKAEANDQGLAIKNEYSYVVALLMRQTTDNGAPDLKLNSVKAGQLNFRNTILANLQNPNPTYLNSMTTEAKVTKKGEDKALYEVKKNSMQMAPNSNFDFPISLDGKPLEAGDYHFHAVVYGQLDDKGEYVYGKDKDGNDVHYRYQWTLDKDFSIAGEVAKKLNDKDVTIKKDYTWIYILIGILLLLLLLLILFIVKRRKDEKRKKDEEQTQA